MRTCGQRTLLALWRPACDVLNDRHAVMARLSHSLSLSWRLWCQSTQPSSPPLLSPAPLIPGGWLSASFGRVSNHRLLAFCSGFPFLCLHSPLAILSRLAHHYLPPQYRLLRLGISHDLSTLRRPFCSPSLPPRYFSPCRLRNNNSSYYLHFCSRGNHTFYSCALALLCELRVVFSTPSVRCFIFASTHDAIASSNTIITKPTTCSRSTRLCRTL